MASQVIHLENFRQKKIEPRSSCDPQLLTTTVLPKIRQITSYPGKQIGHLLSIRDWGWRCVRISNMFINTS